MTKYKYFFGSDLRSLPYLTTIHNFEKTIKVVTTPPAQKGRGKKLQYNPVEEYCRKNNLEFTYYSSNDIYHDMEIGISASFSKIFNSNFLNNNSKIFNIHLSLLPKLRGPSPVEYAILNEDEFTGITVFQINNSIDTGMVLYQEKLEIHNTDYASNVYDKLSKLFTRSYPLIDFSANLKEQVGKSTSTTKFDKNSLNIMDDNLDNAKIKIRAFNVLGPAFTYFNDKVLKIHSYTEEANSEGIIFNEGVLYPEYVTPEGKRQMLFPDYIRGIK